MGTYLLPGGLFRFDLLEFYPHVIGFQALMQFLLGPLIYLYVRACTQKGFKMKSILWLHFLPFIIDVILQMPSLMESGALKLAYYRDFVDTGALKNSRFLVAIKSLHVIVYFILSIILIRKYSNHLPNRVSRVDVSYHRWLTIFASLVVLPIILLIGFSLTSYSRDYSILFWLLGVTFFLLSIDIAIAVKPELFISFPHQMLIPKSSEERKQKYESSTLAVTQKDKYLEKLKNYLQTEQPYHEPELSLGDLSTQLDIPPHYLSQVINEKLGTNFLDLINQYRVEDAKVQLSDPEKDHLTIMAMAYDSGFNSRSTFYSAFKKHAGITPSEYKKQVERVVA